MDTLVALVLSLIAATSLADEARTLHVAPNGSDEQDCLTPATACASFDRAYHAASPGEVVEVAAGNYPQQHFSADPSKRSPVDVVVRPAPGARVVVGCSGPDNCLATEGADHLTVQGVVTADLAPIDGMRRQGGVALDRGSNDVTFKDIDAGHIWFAASNSSVIGGDFGPTVDEDTKLAGGEAQNILIDGAYFHHMYDRAAHMQCIWVVGANGLTIRRSRFDTCSTFGIFVTPEVGEHLRNVVIENNFFSNSGRVSMSTHVKIGSHGGNCTNFLMRNNTFIDDDVISDCGIEDGKATNIRWIGNIFAEGHLDCDTGGHVFDYNVVERGRACGPHEVAVGAGKAGYADRAGLDLRLKQGSPAIDRGSPSDSPPTDIDGNPRPFGDRPDAGADEFGAVGGQPPSAGRNPFAGTSLRVRASRRARLRGRRLVYRVRCSEPCRLQARLVARPRVSRRLGIGRGRKVIGRGSARRSRPGTTRLVVRVKPTAADALRRAGRARLILRITARDRAGRSRTFTRRVTVLA